MKTNKIRLDISAFETLPLIRSVGLYNVESKNEEKVSFKKDILKLGAAKITRDTYTMDINLGGIYPFNLIKFDSVGLDSYEVWVFNGTDLEFVEKKEVNKASEEYKFSKIIDYSYRVVLKFTPQSSYEFIKRNAEIYLV